MKNPCKWAHGVVVIVALAGAAACDAPRSAARARAETACDRACTPAPSRPADKCPTETCLQSSTPLDPNACQAPHLAAKDLPASGELRLGQGFLSSEVVGWEPGFCPRMPTVRWALALVHASRLDQLAGLAITADQFLATAIKESTLGCDPAWSPCLPSLPASVHDGCFQMTCSAGYAQMRQSYGARFAAPPCSTLFGSHFETSALAKSYYDRWAYAVLRARDPNADAFFAQARDPLALIKTLAYAYNQGVYAPGILALLQGNRDACLAMPSLTHDAEDARLSPTLCFPNATGHDYAWAVGRVTAALQAAESPLYDVPVSWSQVQDYLDRIRPLFPELDCPGVVASVQASYDRAAAGRNTLSFRFELGPVLDALLLALPQPEVPSEVVPYPP